MLEALLGGQGGLDVLFIGAHCDDIEIGCGGTITQLAETPNRVACIRWLVLSGNDAREQETRHAARLLTGDRAEVYVCRFRNGYFPYVGADIKDHFEDIKARWQPDLIFTHSGSDRHQDHRLVNELTWNTFRDHLILEYEIPKYDGDLGQPNLFVPLSRSECERKVETLLEAFPSQSGRRWFDADAFRGLMRLRGMEVNSDSGFAEAYYCRKLRLWVRETGPSEPEA